MGINDAVLTGYRFFDYKYNISGFSSDFFSTNHIFYIILAYVSIIFIAIFAKKVNHKKIDLYLKILSIAALVLEIVKISWESYYDITTGRGFNKEGILPLYTCSLFIYCSLLAAWFKGRTKDIALSYLGTVGLIAGAIGVVYCNGLNFYPFWTFGAFYSLFFHYFMFATGVFLISSGYKKLEWIDVFKSWIPIIILSLIAIPFNYMYHSDYMQVYDASGVPVLHDLGVKMGEAGIRPLFTIIMIFMYIPLSAIPVGIYKLICNLSIKKTENTNLKEA